MSTASLLERAYAPNLSNTQIFKKYSINDFNCRLHISKTGPEMIESAALALGHSLRKHKLDDLIGVCHVHNHFKLNENEIVEAKMIASNESIGDRSSLMQPKILHLHIAKLDVDVDTSANDPPIPYMWSFDKSSKQLVPFQFFHGSTKEMRGRFEALSQRSEIFCQFFEEFVQTVEQHKMEDLLGIFLIQTCMFDYDRNEQQIIEVTNESQREQWMYVDSARNVKQLKANSPNLIKTTHWIYGNDTVECIECIGNR